MPAFPARLPAVLPVVRFVSQRAQLAQKAETFDFTLVEMGHFEILMNPITYKQQMPYELFQTHNLLICYANNVFSWSRDEALFASFARFAKFKM